jgi:hypothetical protein
MKIAGFNKENGVKGTDKNSSGSQGNNVFEMIVSCSRRME